MLHYNPRHVQSSTVLILRRSNFIITASGMVTLCKRSYSTPVESGFCPLSTGTLYGRLQRVTIPDAVIIQFHFLKMSIVLFRSVIPVVYLRTNQTNTCRRGSQKHNYICNIQDFIVYTCLSANYMFRPLPVRPSSGWIPQSEEMYNSAIQPLKSGGDEIYCIFPLTKVSKLKMV